MPITTRKPRNYRLDVGKGNVRKHSSPPSRLPPSEQPRPARMHMDPELLPYLLSLTCAALTTYDNTFNFGRVVTSLQTI